MAAPDLTNPDFFEEFNAAYYGGTLATKPPDRPDLTNPRPGSKARSPLDVWLKTHPEALSVLDEWVDRRAKGETVWTLRDVIAEFIVRYNMPKFGDSGFRGWLERNRTAAYRQGSTK